MFKRFRRPGSVALLVFLFTLILSPYAANAATYAVEVVHYTGSTSVQAGNFESDLKAALTKLGVDTSQVKYTNAITTQFSATDSFAWTTFDHTGNWGEDPYPNGDQNPNGGQYNKHIIVKNNGKSITFYGYGQPSYKDFMFMPNNDTNSTKTFTFDLNEEGIKYHSMEGGGFLFNSSLANGIISGYALLFDSSGIELFELTNVNANNFHNATDAQMHDVPGIKSIKTFVKGSAKNHSIKIVAGAEQIDMWDNGAKIIDGYKLPNKHGSGFGPIASYNEHDCNELSYFTFSNLQMSMTLLLTLADVIDQAKWGACSNHYILNLQDTPVADFSDQPTLNKILAKMSKDKAFYLGWGTEANKQQALDFIQKNGNKGAFIDNTDYKASVDKIAANIADQLKADIAAAKGALTPGFASGDSANSITKNLTLPGTINTNCTTVSWSSSNPALLSNSGVITRPEGGDGTVTLTATITKGGISDTKQFTFVIKQRVELVKTGSPIDTMTLTVLGLAFIMAGIFAVGRKKQVNP